MASVVGKRKFVLRDALEKKKEIELGIAQLSQKKDVLDTKVKEGTSALGTQRKQLQDLEKAFEESRGTTATFCEGAKRILVDYLDAIQEAEKILQLYFEGIDLMGRRLEDQRLEVSTLDAQKSAIHKEMLHEGAVLAQRKVDLDIYKARLEKYIEDAGAKIKVIL